MILEQRTEHHSSKALTILSLASLLALTLFAGCVGSTAPQPTYTAEWQGKTISLALVTNTSIDKLSGATNQGQVTNFQTSDKNYSCFIGLSLNVYIDSTDFPQQLVVYGSCPTTTGGTTRTQSGIWTFSPPTPTPTPFTYAATFQGQSVTLTLVQGGSLPKGAPLLSQITNFTTNDPSYQCLNSVSSIKVWNGQEAFPGKYVVFVGCPGRSTGLWTFNVVYSYIATWQAKVRNLVPVIAKSTPPVDAILEGSISNFTTTDPSYTCQNGNQLNAYSEPNEFKPDMTGLARYVVYGGCPNGIAGVWVFEAVQGNFIYSAMWKGQKVSLTLITTAPSNSTALPDKVTDFFTDDPDYLCFNNGSFLVWMVADYPTNQFLVYDNCGNGMFGAWIFQSS